MAQDQNSQQSGDGQAQQPQDTGSMHMVSGNEPSFKGSTISYETQQPGANAPYADPAPDDMDSDG